MLVGGAAGDKPVISMTLLEFITAVRPWTSLLWSLFVPLVIYFYARAWFTDRMREFEDREKTRQEKREDKQKSLLAEFEARGEAWEKRSTARHDATEKAWTDGVAEFRASVKDAKAEFNREVTEHTTRNMNTLSAIEQRLRALEEPKEP